MLKYKMLFIKYLEIGFILLNKCELSNVKKRVMEARAGRRQLVPTEPIIRRMARAATALIASMSAKPGSMEV